MSGGKRNHEVPTGPRLGSLVTAGYSVQQGKENVRF